MAFAGSSWVFTVAGATRIEPHFEPVMIVAYLIFSVPLCLLA